MTASAFEGEIVLPDGRHELTPEADAALGESRLHNKDLAPVPITKRTWTTYNYLALWVGMSINIPSWLLASGLVALGMAWYQAILTIALANVIVLIPMLLISHAGTKYGIPYPVFARAAFGVFGANLPALIRAGVACGWFGIQTWIGGTAVFAVVAALLGEGSFWTTAGTLAIGFGDPQPWTVWLSFAVFWAINILVILRGMDAVRRFENWAAPFLIVVFAGLLVFMVIQAGGLGPIVSEPGTLGWGSGFWAIFPLSLMGMIAFWSTLSLNMPDFTRFGKSQREQVLGQVVALPTTMTVFAAMGVLITSATVIIFGRAIWDPVQLVAQFKAPVVVAISMFTAVVATLAVNIAANVVSPANDFANAFPRLIRFKTGGLITGIIGILMQPWKLLADPSGYIFLWLLGYSGGLGSIAGVLIADYWLVRRKELVLEDLYLVHGAYRYGGGWNWKAVVATVVGCALAWGGLVVPSLKPLYSYAWFVGFLASGLLYWALSARARPVAVREAVAGADAAD